MFNNVTAFSGDITCTFESPQWDRGHCNWEYEFGSKNLFGREYQPRNYGQDPHKVTWKHGELHKSTLVPYKVGVTCFNVKLGNHYLKEEGPAHVRLQTKGDFKCSTVKGEGIFGFEYKMTGTKVLLLQPYIFGQSKWKSWHGQ